MGQKLDTSQKYFIKHVTCIFLCDYFGFGLKCLEFVLGSGFQLFLVAVVPSGQGREHRPGL